MTDVSVSPLTTSIGAEIAGVDLTQPLDDDVFHAIRQALLDWGVIFFRDQDLTHDQHLAFGRMFGELHMHPVAKGLDDHPEVLRVLTDENSSRAVGDVWHSDVTCDEEPPMASILRMVELPPVGGDTLFANMGLAFERMPPALQTMISGLTASHSRKDGEWPSAHHPVVRTHPETGRKTLFVNEAFTHHIDGLPRQESAVLLRALMDHAKDPNIQCRFRWKRNSIAMWDNRAVQHLAVFDYFPARRLGYRVTVKGDRPV